MKRVFGGRFSKRVMKACWCVGVTVICGLSVLLRVQADEATFTQNTPTNHAMSIEVPLMAYPGRGVSLPVTLRYSTGGLWRIGFIRAIPMGSSVWRSVTEAIYSEHSTAGWTTSLDVPKVEWPKQNDIYWYTGKSYTRGTVPPYTFRVAQLFMHMPDGSSHEMRKQDAVYADGGVITMTGTFYSVDGSRMRYDSTGENTGTLYLPDGGRYILGSTTVQYIDRNGNTLNFNMTTRQWTDTLGRVIGMPWPVNPGPGDYSYALPGVNGSTFSYTLKFRALSAALTPDAFGIPPAMKAAGDYYLPDPNSPPTGPGGGNFPQVTSGASLFVSGYSDPEETSQSYSYVVGRGQSDSSVFNPTVLAEIVFPNGQSYKFSYNIHGELNKVIYPTGGFQRYQHSQVGTIGFSQVPYLQGNRGMISRWISANGTGSDEAQYQYSTGNSPMTVTAPDGTRTEAYFFIPPNNDQNFGYRDSRQGALIEERTYAPVAQGGAMLRRTLHSYGQTTSINNKPVPPGTFNSGTYTAYRNPRLEKTVSLILDTGGDALAKTITNEYANNTYDFTTGFDLTASTETHFQAVDQTTAQSGAITAIPAGPTAQRLETAYVNNPAYQSRNILGLPTSTVSKGIVGGILQTVRRTDFFYDEIAYPLLTYGDLGSPDYIDPGTGARGNVTTTRRYVDPGTGVYLDTHDQFDQCGNLRNTWNERGTLTQTDYSSTYKHAFATQATSAIPDPSGVNGSNTAFVTSSTFDYNTGQVATTTDANGQVTSYSYKDDQNVNDVLNRLRKITRPNGGWTKYSFGDTLGNLFTLTETQQDATRTLKTYEYVDPLGRTTRKFASENASSYIATDIIYDQMGREWKSSNPYRTTTLDGVSDLSHTSHWTVSDYDPLGRITTITFPDGSQVQNSFQGIYTTVTDQAGKQRRHKVDALLRVVRVDEPDASGNLGTVDAPVQPTSYDYDTAGNVVHVTQGTGGTLQHRYFKYDGLGRLTYERQVEQVAAFTASDPVSGNSSWTRKLVYDETLSLVTYSGLLTSVYDARNVQTQFRYDNVNRANQVSYSDGTPAITNKYDQARTGYFNRGHVTEALTAAAGSMPATSQLYDFDLMGRIVHHVQTVGAQTYSTSYGYNIGGGLTSQTYPSGRVVNFGFDDGARLSQVSSGSTVYGQFDYTSPSGMLKAVTLGNGAVENYVYNSRLQLQSSDLTRSGTQIQHYDYKYGVYNPATNTVDESKNNGQIAQIEGFIATQKQWQQSFTYDKLGRLSSGREFRGDNSQQSYLVNYDYDVFGNRYQKQAQNPGNPFTQFWVETNDISGATNRFNSGLTYDNAGNVTVDSRFRNRRYDYDANNRQKQSRNLDNSGAVDSVFDAGGQRVATQVGGSLTSVLVYDVTGKLLAEYNLTTASGGTQYIFNDHQSSPRVATSSSGTVIARHDYLPFGEDALNAVGLRASVSGYGASEAARQKYTGMEYNEATGMAHTLWRQYDSYSARWTAPDPYGGSMQITTPQSFNRYTYVNNDPVNKVDPTGLMLSDIGVYQTTSSGQALLVERMAHRAFKQSVAPPAIGGIGKVMGKVAARNPNLKTISFVRRGEVNLLGRKVPLYIATGQTQEYEQKAIKNAEEAAEIINSRQDTLTDEQKALLGQIDVIGAPGVNVRWDEAFYVDGIEGVDSGAVGINITGPVGAYFSHSITTFPAKWFAPEIFHEGRHRYDYVMKIGVYGPIMPEGPGDATEKDERRALTTQLDVYRRLMGIKPGTPPDPYERMLLPLIEKPHRRTFKD